MDAHAILTAVRRSEQKWCEQICEWESLGFGVAYHSAKYDSLPEANQLRDVWLADTDPEDAFAKAEAYYAERGTQCQIWVPGSGQAVEPMEALLASKGWRREEIWAMGLAEMGSRQGAGKGSRRGAEGAEEKAKAEDIRPAQNLAAARESPASEEIRVLPARAMHRAYRASLEESAGGNEQVLDAAFERLDDANHDAFVAMIDKTPAGRISYLEAGEIARVTDFHVAPAFDEVAVGAALMRHFLEIVWRLGPRLVVARVPEQETTYKSFLEQWGFKAAGKLVQFRRG